MIPRSFHIALRVFRKHVGYSLINVFGLAVGIASFALISLFVRDELSYDKHHLDADRVYRVTFIGQPPSGGVDLYAVASSPVATTIRDEVAEVESVARLVNFNAKVLHGDTYFFDDRKWFVEPELLDIFTMPFIEGEREGQLERPETMVITESMADKYFAGESPLGQTLTLNDSLDYEVTGVIADTPEASHFEGDMFISWATRDQMSNGEEGGWLQLGVYVYIKTVPGANYDALSTRIRGLAHEKIGAELDQFNFKAEFELEPIKDIYLKSKLSSQIKVGGDMTHVWVFSAVAAFILLLAGINFTNLATARSMERAREVGVRKAIGSSRGRLIAQFLGESLLLSGVALVIGLVVAAASLDLLNNIAGKELTQAMLFRAETLGILFIAALITGLLGALYPAILLSGFNPVDVLKGSHHSTRSGAHVRKGLVSIQFAISIGLISATILVMNQLSFMQQQELGFDMDQVMVVETRLIPRNDLQPRVASVLSEFEGLSSVQKAAFSQAVPGTGMGRVLFTTEDLAEDDIRSAAMTNVGFDYFEIYNIPMVAGRTFSRDFPSDIDDGMLINEDLARSVGWINPEDALGKVFPMGGSGRHVIGVAKDYHHSSLKTEIQPTIFLPSERVNNYLSLKISGSNAFRAVEAASTLWSSQFPAYPFESWFMDDNFNKQYQSEERLRDVFSLFSALAILIACLGLFGLSAFTAQQRTKEIGIRKIMGASVPSLVTLLSREFAFLVVVGLVAAVPITIYGMNLWLEPFPYQTAIEWWVFGVAGLAALGIALGTVSYHAKKVASGDLVASLRNE